MPKVSFRMASASREWVFGVQTNTARKNSSVRPHRGPVDHRAKLMLRTEGNGHRHTPSVQHSCGAPEGARSRKRAAQKRAVHAAAPSKRRRSPAQDAARRRTSRTAIGKVDGHITK